MPKITELNAITTVANNDLLMVVHDPSGLPSTNKITVNNFVTSVSTQLRGYTGSIGVGYAGSTGTGYTGSSGSSINTAQGNNGFLPVSSGSNTFTWLANPDVRASLFISNTSYTATSNDSVIIVNPALATSNVTITLPHNPTEGKIYTVKSIFNNAGQYIVSVTTTTPGINLIEDPILGSAVSSFDLEHSNEGYSWIFTTGIYRAFSSIQNSPIFYGNANTYHQVAIKNASANSEASADLVVYNDLAAIEDDAGPYIDIGINSSQYDQAQYNIGGPNDSYVYNKGGDLTIGTANTGTSLILHAGGTTNVDSKAVINSTAIFANTNLIPTQNNVFSLGSANKQWKELWVSNNTIYIGGFPITVDASGVLSVNGSISTGYTGSTGSTGSVGFTGSIGSAGYTGSEGAAGSAGSAGYTGSEGAAGSTGSIGYTGSQGASGSLGYTGSEGSLGYTGSVGAGYAGSQGNIGYTGSEGATGFTGSAGAGSNTGNFTFTSNNSIELSSANTIYLVDNWGMGVELVSNLSVQLTWAYSVDSIGYSGNTGYFYINSNGAYVDFYDGVTSKTWNFSSNGDLVFPDNTTQNTAFTNSKTLTTISSAGPTVIVNDVTFADPNAAGANVNLVFPSSPASGKVYTVKNINAGGKVVYVQTDGTDSMENESGSIGTGVYATISASGSRITWIYDGGTSTYRIID